LGQPRDPSGDLTAPVIPAIYAVHLLQLAARWQLDPAVLLENGGLGAAELEAPQARVSPLTFWRLAERAVELTGEPGLGFYFGLALNVPSHGIVGFAAMSSATLRDALKVAERFVPLRAPPLSLSLLEQGDHAVLELREVIAQPPQAVLFTCEALFTAFIQMARSLLGRSVPARFELTHAEPAYFPRFSHLWPGPVRFERAANRIIFGRSLLDESLQMADAVAARQAIIECERELALLREGGSFLATIRRQLAVRSRGYPSLSELARERHVSVRTMKRQLAAVGTSYQQLLDELRRDRALCLLEDEKNTIEQIADQLGYSDASNFHRAFRRWLGRSPASFRPARVKPSSGDS
jgi:AraC-like DNA-binding protein